jgi:hypothetical protein
MAQEVTKVSPKESLSIEEREKVEGLVPLILELINSQLDADEYGIVQMDVIDKMAKAGTSVVCKVRVVFEDGQETISVLKMFDASLMSVDVIASMGDIMEREIDIYNILREKLPNAEWLVQPAFWHYQGEEGLNFILMPLIETQGVELPIEERMVRLAKMHDIINKEWIYNFDGSLNNMLTSTKLDDYWIDMAGFVMPQVEGIDEFLLFPRTFCEFIPLRKLVLTHKPDIHFMLERNFKGKATLALLFAIFMVSICKFPAGFSVMEEVLMMYFVDKEFTTSEQESYINAFWDEVGKKVTNFGSMPLANKVAVDAIMAHLVGKKSIPGKSNQGIIEALLQLMKSYNSQV